MVARDKAQMKRDRERARRGVAFNLYMRGAAPDVIGRFLGVAADEVNAWKAETIAEGLDWDEAREAKAQVDRMNLRDAVHLCAQELHAADPEETPEYYARLSTVLRLLRWLREEPTDDMLRTLSDMWQFAQTQNMNAHELGLIRKSIERFFQGPLADLIAAVGQQKVFGAAPRPVAASPDDGARRE